MKFVVIACLGAGALAAVGCADGHGLPTSPSASAAVSSLAATAPGNEGAARPAGASSLSASPRSGILQVTKECSGYTGGAGSFFEHLSQGIKEVNGKQVEADKMSTDLATGKTENLHETMLATSQAELTFNLMVQLRNKALEAYTEVMRMPV